MTAVTPVVTPVATPVSRADQATLDGKIFAGLPEHPTKDVLVEKCEPCDTIVGASPACALLRHDAKPLLLRRARHAHGSRAPRRRRGRLAHRAQRDLRNARDDRHAHRCGPQVSGSRTTCAASTSAVRCGCCDYAVPDGRPSTCSSTSRASSTSSKSSASSRTHADGRRRRGAAVDTPSRVSASGATSASSTSGRTRR